MSLFECCEERAIGGSVRKVDYFKTAESRIKRPQKGPKRVEFRVLVNHYWAGGGDFSLQQEQWRDEGGAIQVKSSEKMCSRTVRLITEKQGNL